MNIHTRLHPSDLSQFMAKDPLEDISILRSALYDVAIENAEDLSGQDVLRILKTVSEDMFEAGIDEALRHTEKKIDKWENIADAWDLTWLTLFTLKLHQHDRRRNTRS